MPALCIRIVGNTNTQTLGKHEGTRITVIVRPEVVLELFRAIDTDKTNNTGVGKDFGRINVSALKYDNMQYKNCRWTAETDTHDSLTQVLNPYVAYVLETTH